MRQHAPSPTDSVFNLEFTIHYYYKAKLLVEIIPK